MIFLSSPHTKYYKALHLIIIGIFLSAIGPILYFSNSTFTSVFATLQLLFFSYLLSKRLPMIKELSYDQENLYIKHGKREETLPLKAIREVELKTLGGNWKIDFRPGYTKKESLIFLPSLIYPLYYKKTEAKVDRFVHAFRQRNDTDREASCEKLNLL